MSDSLSQGELRQRFDSRVRPYLDSLRNGIRDPRTSPRFVSVGGQPGAGKGRALEEAKQAIPDSVAVDADDLRRFHPDYERLMREEPLRMPDATAAASGQWVGMSNAYLRSQRASAVVETTLRQPDVLLREFEAFRRAGYETELRVVAVPLEVSRAGTLSRYVEQVKKSTVGRWTKGEHHDVAAAAVPGTVASLVESGLVDRVVVQDRDGRIFHDARVSNGGTENAQRAAAAVNQARDVTSMSQQQARSWVERTETALSERIRLGENDPDLVRVARRLSTTDAAAVVPRAYPGDENAQREALARMGALGRPTAKEPVAETRTASFPAPATSATRSAPDAAAQVPRPTPGVGRDDKGIGR